MRQKNRSAFTKLIVIGILILAGFWALEHFYYQSTNFEKRVEERNKALKDLPQDATIKIGVAWPFFLEEGDNYFKEGIEFALKQINKEKLLGREVEVVYKDDKWEKSDALSIAYSFANDPTVVAVIAHDDSELAIPASIIYEHAHIVMLSPAVSDPNFTRTNFDYIFRNTPSDIDIGNRLAGLSAMMNFKKVVVINAKNNYSRQIAKIYTKEVLNLGCEVVYMEEFDDTEPDFSKILSHLSPTINTNIDYDAIFIASYEENGIAFINEARKYKIYSPIITGDMLDGNAILEAGKNMDGTIVASIYNSQLLNVDTQNFINAFYQEYKFLPDTWSAQGYDAMMLLAKSIKEIGSLNTQKLAVKLKYTRNYRSIFGTYSFSEKGDIDGREIYFKRVSNGKFEYLYFD
ncbi:MAG: ABC transporter substrate-binding protein [Campylobacterales bacterium]|nr:ABC transporter substrate-binding protein [Campylobacterales bacterium]